MFYRDFKDWRKETGKGWKQEDLWTVAMVDCLCKILPENEKCQPAAQAQWNNFMTTLTDNGVNSLYGPNWEADVQRICDLDPLAYECTYLTELKDAYPEGREEIPLRMVDHMAQQAWAQQFVEYNENYATNGWFTDPTQYPIADTTAGVP